MNFSRHQVDQLGVDVQVGGDFVQRSSEKACERWNGHWGGVEITQLKTEHAEDEIPEASLCASNNGAEGCKDGDNES